MNAKQLAKKWNRGDLTRAEVQKICLIKSISFNSVRDARNAVIFARNASNDKFLRGNS